MIARGAGRRRGRPEGPPAGKRVANGLGRLNLAAELGLLGIDALIVQGA